MTGHSRFELEEYWYGYRYGVLRTTPNGYTDWRVIGTDDGIVKESLAPARAPRLGRLGDAGPGVVGQTV